jgi:4-amino-4-deoxy-L-arabinose transferase-like glycosyltransferase
LETPLPSSTARALLDTGSRAVASQAGGDDASAAGISSLRARAGTGEAWFLAALVLLAFGLRVAGLDAQSLWRDEVDAVRFALRPMGEVLSTFATPGENGPLYYLLLRPWLAVAGSGEFALRFFSAAMGVLAVPLVARLARRLPGAEARPALGSLAALLAATSPYLAWYGQEGKMYTLVVVLVLWAMERYLAALRHGGWQRWLVAVAATTAAFYVHLVAALIVPVQVLVFLLHDASVRRARWRAGLASLAALTLPYLPMLAWQLPLLTRRAETGYAFVPLNEMALSLLAGYSLGVVQEATPWALAVFVLALLLSGLLAWRQGWAMLLSWLLAPVVAFFAITLLRPIYTARYLVFILPAYLLLLAAGLLAAARRSRLLGVALALAILALNARGLWLQARTPLKTDFRGATAYLRQSAAPDDLILFQIPYGRHSFDYYMARPELLPGADDGPAGAAAPRGEGRFRLFLPLAVAGGTAGYRWAEGLYTNGGMEPADVAARMAEMTAGSPTVWLVASEVSLWDQRGLVQAWLEEHATRTRAAEFTRVTVYRYELQSRPY